MAILKYLDCSTGHLSAFDRNLLLVAAETHGSAFFVNGAVVRPYTEGWFITVIEPGNPADVLVPALDELLAYAREHDCRMIRLDCDGDTVDGVTMYED